MAERSLPPPLESALAALRRQRHGEAQRLCEAVLAHDRKSADAHDILSQVAFEQGRTDDSIEHLRQAVRLEPKRARLRTNLGRAYARVGRYAEAHGQYDKALKLAPDDPITLAEKATAYERQDKYDRARRLLRGPMGRGTPPPALASVSLRVLIHDGDYEAAIELGRRVLAANPRPSAFLRATCFELARAHERSGDYDEAFAVAARANAMLAPAYDPAADRAAFEHLMAVCGRDALAALPHPQDPTSRPVFVFGMPRSGTTLVERILHAHPDAHGLGETGIVHVFGASLPDRLETTTPYPDCIREIDAGRIDGLAAALTEILVRSAPDVPRVVDKSLDTQFHLGLVSVLLPGARLVHCRRDPVDTCLSCFMERLTPASHPYATDLEHLATRLRLHERLMAHWKDALDVEILEIDYESVVADPETESRRLVAFAGLPWDDACLRSHEVARSDRTLSFDQVRRPIYATSVNRADRFGAHLDPLRRALAAD